jgi:phage shock protein C
MAKKIFRSLNDRIVAGVCGGIGDYFNVDSNLVRIVFLLLLGLWGTGFIAYIAAWILLPEKETGI